MKNSRVLISGMQGLGVEIAKNIILAGVKSLTLHDENVVELLELSTDFVFAGEDIGKNRALASVQKLQELNNAVAVSIMTGKLSKEQLSDFQAVVFVGISFEKATEFDDYCHSHQPPIAFIKADARGLFGSLFCDFGPHFTVIDVDGEQPQPQPKVLNFKPLREALKDPGDFLLSDFSKFDRPPLLHLAFQAVDKFSSQAGRFPFAGSEEDAQKLVEIATDINESLGDARLEDVNSKLLRNFAFGSRTVLNPTAAMFGGIVGQEVVKACSGKFHPVFQFFYFDSVESLPKGTLDASEFRPQNSRYDAQISLHEAFQSKLELVIEETKKYVTYKKTLFAQEHKVLQDEAIKQKDPLLGEITNLQNELQQARDDYDRLVVQSQKRAEEHEHLKGLFVQSQKLAEEQKRQLCEGELIRKELHNTIQELKGNIRVFCRVRPWLHVDGGRREEVVISYPTSTKARGRGVDLVQNGTKHSFTFDKIFNHEASQEEVFSEISQLVQSALDGYKVCIFAYGQTGSGKTYTMMGRLETPETKGLIPRSLEQIFQASQSLGAQGWKYKMQVSMLEIYNESIRDLISTSGTSMEFVQAESSRSLKPLEIKHDEYGNAHVTDLTIVDVSSVGEIYSLLQQAARSRSVGRTQMNEQSSRSHLVFTMQISGVNESTEQQVQGVLNLIDLAGNESLSKSGVTGEEQVKETKAINKSLSALGDVISAIANKGDHVPFRNSKLTFLLKPCLSGDSKTLMLVNISPVPSSAGESLTSLRFAARVNACEIGTPRRQTAVKVFDSQVKSKKRRH